MAINTLRELYKQKGELFVKNLFNLEVEITEKYSGSAFSFEIKNGNFLFYKKNINIPISKVERLVMKCYEEPIKHIENISEKLIPVLPEKHRFNFEYFPNTHPNTILYDSLPKNKLILTNILKQDENNNIIENIKTEETIKYYADMLEVSPIQKIFKGKLNSIQKEKILNFLKLSEKELYEKYSKQSFNGFIIELLNPEISETLLHKNLDNVIEGVVFCFNNKTENLYTKLSDPVFEYILQQTKVNEDRSDILKILFSNIIEFMEKESTNFSNFYFSKIDFEDRYIEFISYFFNKFINEFGSKYEDIDLGLPEFMKKEEFDLNNQLISNIETFELVNKNDNYRQIFKIFLMFFRKIKRSEKEFLLPSVINYQNKLVSQIADLLKEGNEDSFPSFSQFIDVFGNEKDC